MHLFQDPRWSINEGLFQGSERGLWRRTGLRWDLDSVHSEGAWGIDTLTHAPRSLPSPLLSKEPVRHPHPQQPPGAEDRAEEWWEDVEGPRERPGAVLHGREVRVGQRALPSCCLDGRSSVDLAWFLMPRRHPIDVGFGVLARPSAYHVRCSSSAPRAAVARGSGLLDLIPSCSHAEGQLPPGPAETVS